MNQDVHMLWPSASRRELLRGFAQTRQDLLLILDNRLLVPDNVVLIADYRPELALVPEYFLFVRDDSLLVLERRPGHVLSPL
jgi:hypothetical protein